MFGEIVLPETKPETEWVRGRALQKVSPTYAHGLAQRRLAAAIGQWADESQCGRVASEWRFYVAPPGEPARPLVPDVAFLSYAALPRDAAPALVAVPRMAPSVAFEILSPGDRAADVEHNTSVYLAAGADAVVVIDTASRSAVVFDRDGRCELAVHSDLTHAAVASRMRATHAGVPRFLGRTRRGAKAKRVGAWGVRKLW